jgi:serine/threonine protein kinase
VTGLPPAGGGGEMPRCANLAVRFVRHQRLRPTPMTSASPIKALPQGFKLDDCVVERQISRGGFSIVYLARDPAGAPLAIKEYMPAGIAQRSGSSPVPVVPPELRGAFIAGMKAFFEEGRLLARINHPNVVHVQNFFRANETAYMVMPYVKGKSLHEVIRASIVSCEPLREEFLREVFVRLLSGLREVHLQKLLHLDIKPANIFLRRDGSPLLLDFGATRLGLGDSPSSLAAVHTPDYGAPEQEGSGEPLGPWTDIYAIGATLYSCLAGRPPPPAAQRMVKDEFESAQKTWFRQYSPQLLELIDWCLKLEAGQRPQSVFALQKVLNGDLLDLVDPTWFASPDAPKG